MKQDLVEYLVDAITRAESGGVSSPSGSWIAGIFGKGDNLFDKEVHSYVLRLLNTCGLDYEINLRDQIKGRPRLDKLTLGKLIDVIEEGAKLRPQAVARHVPGGWKVTGFVKALRKINGTWVQHKHGKEVAESTLTAQMKSMLV